MSLRSTQSCVGAALWAIMKYKVSPVNWLKSIQMLSIDDQFLFMINYVCTQTQDS